jgi:hypothetical protein
MRTGIHPAGAAAAFVLALHLPASGHAATLTVTTLADRGPGSLRSAIGAARSGDTVVFAPGLTGTIHLQDAVAIQASVQILGPGPDQLAVSGDGSAGLFQIEQALTVGIDGLTLTEGRADGWGGGAILNLGGTAILTNDVFADNVATGLDANGGAIENRKGGLVRVTDSTFTGNQALGRHGGGWGRGGAIDNEGATTIVRHCAFRGNLALGGDGGTNNGDFGFGPGLGAGGAINANDGSSVIIEDSEFSANQAIGGSGGSGGKSTPLVGVGQGGAIRSHDTSTLSVARSSFVGNLALGGSGTTGAADGLGSLGSGRGGAILNQGAMQIVDSLLEGNVAQGGSGGVATSGAAQNGTGLGGGIFSTGNFNASTLVAWNVTLASNQALGGAGTSGGLVAGAGWGGGLFVWNQGYATDVTFGASTIAGNEAAGDGGGVGGGVYVVPGASVCIQDDTVISGNEATSSNDDVFGALTPC